MAKTPKTKPFAERYRDVSLVGDCCGEFALKYTPTEAHGKPQRTSLDAEDEDNARFEAASMLECEESELPATEWA